MDEEEAFEKLGLTPDASKEDISLKYKELAKKFHPDTGGNIIDMQELSEARDTAIDLIENKTPTIKDIKEIIKSQNKTIANKIQQIESQKKLIDYIIKDCTRSDRSYKRFSIFTGSFSALLFLVADKIGSFDTTYLATNSTAYISIKSIYFTKNFLLLFAFLFGLIFIQTSIKINRIERIIEDINYLLESKKNYFQLLKQFKSSEKKDLTTYDENNFTELQLERDITAWRKNQEKSSTSTKIEINLAKPFYKMTTENSIPEHLRSPIILKTIKAIGEEHFSQLFISKGLELGILEEHEKIENDELVIRYSLSIEKN